ncbi:1,5-anhydro-D-fructose reductase [Pontiella desulfatans]|uniref:1,5-anhydro-D-fructose reductase n=1 Tax=Pontiella desulfatans TaxID=2750659 RepID=A0A6C2U917_PONDE|nr:Gfo/Idh/MocA family oxidoreductase [Pontiella desulfatans]VGO15886.1 1,5-anhydro-D-fructose reductase [Pontiella desulfatans]
MAETVKAGIIGCGNISPAYFAAAKKLELLEIVSCADLIGQKAEDKAEENGVKAVSVQELLADPEIGIVINLTTPQAHAEVNLQALHAGKHVHCEKPFAITREDGQKVLALAQEKGLLTGCAPDTFLGGGLQTCRKLVDDGWIGKPVAGTAFMCCPGHESWHPNPGFYYLRGGGPMLDMGPYYLTALVNLLGPVKRVAAIAGRKANERLATSEEASGQVLPVEVNTHAAGTLEFRNGAIITLVMSFDVWKHGNHPIELHGTSGSLRIPDPNCFDGEVSVFRAGMDDWETVPLSHGYTDNMRSIGAADMAYAIQSGRPNRCSGEMAYHILDVMLAFDESSETGQHIDIASTCEQPAPLPLDLPAGKLDE